MRRTALRLGAVGLLSSLCLLGVAPSAQAHPLGNTTVNHYDGLALFPDRIVDTAVEDLAEIPTFQRKGQVDTDGDGTLTDAERATFAAARCADLARTLKIVVNGDRVTMAVDDSGYAERDGTVGLKAGRLECTLTGRVDLRGPATVEVENRWDDDGIGWHEITAVGSGVSLQDSPFPAESVSDELRTYPGELLASPLDVREGVLKTVPGDRGSTYSAVKDVPVAGFAVRQLDRLSQAFNDQVGAERLTVGVGLLAVLLSLLLGAGHAFLPGHGKTIMAAYLVGRGGTLRDVVTVGATVTFTHTAGVLVLGLAITTTTAFAPAQAERWLGVVSGLIVAGVGVGLLVAAVRRRRTPRLAALPLREVVAVGAGPAQHDHAEHTHDQHDPERDQHEHEHERDHHDHHDHHDHEHDHHEHEHEHEDHGHRHGLFGRAHSHTPPTPGQGKGFSRGGLVGLGVAGGLVPSPSALLVLLSAIALGRTSFGVVLVLGYGIGMAVALSAAGLLLVRLRGRLDRLASGTRLARAERLLAVLPVLTALLVLVVGLGLAARAAGGTV